MHTAPPDQESKTHFMEMPIAVFLIGLQHIFLIQVLKILTQWPCNNFLNGVFAMFRSIKSIAYKAGERTLRPFA